METIDLAREFKAQYSATGNPKVVEVGRGTFLATDGQGAPGGDAFTAAIGRLFMVVFALKFGLKGAGGPDFKVPKLEVMYPDDPAEVPDPAQWHWTVMIRIPEQVTGGQVDAIRTQLLETRGIDSLAIRRVTIDEGTCIQKMHVGPYEQVGGTYHELMAAAEAQGITLTGPGHEIYVSDPRRTAPERLKTIVRLTVAS